MFVGVGLNIVISKENGLGKAKVQHKLFIKMFLRLSPEIYYSVLQLLPFLQTYICVFCSEEKH